MKGLLLYLAGVLSTIVGSWIASKIHVYHDNRKLHHEELKQKVLSPIRTALDDSYASLVKHASAVISESWGTQQLVQGAKITEYPEVQGPVLQAADLRGNSERNLDEALLADARENHYRELIVSWERFRDSWTNHSQKCKSWASEVALRILSQSGLAAFPPLLGKPYVMHLRLAVLLYLRLFQIPTEPLRREERDGHWWLVDRSATLATGTEKQIDELLALLEGFLQTEKPTAEVLRQEAERLKSELDSLHQKLSLAIAERQLRRRCSMVTFF
jgi:hypothetical protein